LTTLDETAKRRPSSLQSSALFEPPAPCNGLTIYSFDDDAGSPVNQSSIGAQMIQFSKPASWSKGEKALKSPLVSVAMP